MNSDSCFTIEDIHRIRRENFEKTKHMSPQELIEETNKQTVEIERKIEEIRKMKFKN